MNANGLLEDLVSKDYIDTAVRNSQNVCNFENTDDLHLKLSKETKSKTLEIQKKVLDID
jgi:hypothetical protein